MNPPKVTDEDYVQFLIATPKACSATEAAQVRKDEAKAEAKASAAMSSRTCCIAGRFDAMAGGSAPGRAG